MATQETEALSVVCGVQTYSQASRIGDFVCIWHCCGAYRSVPPPPFCYGTYTTFVAHGQAKDTSVDWARTPTDRDR